MRFPQHLVLALLLTASNFAYAQSSGVPDGTSAFAGPVELVGYAGGVAVEWHAGNSTEVEYYAVERLVDGLAHVVATFRPQANADDASTFRYIDQSDYVPGIQFRVRAAYLNGSYAESDNLPAKPAQASRSRMLSALDSESVARLHIRLDSETRQDVLVEVNTLRGATVANFQKELLTGRNDLEIDYTGWPAGYYNVGLVDAARQRHEWLVHIDDDEASASTRRLPDNS